MFKQIATLLGGSKSVKSLKRSTFRRSLRLGFLKTCRGNLKLLTVILLLSLTGCRMAKAYDTFTNKAVLSYTNAAQAFYYTSIDTANLVVYTGPIMHITKLTENLQTGEQGSNTHTVSAVPGDTVEISLLSQNTGDSTAYWIDIIDTFPAGIGDSTTNNTGMSYIPGSETCTINGSLAADSISWCTNEARTWDVTWQTYNETVSRSIPADCTGIRWRWNRVVSSTENADQSWIRVKFQWFRNQN